ncbi:MAG: porin family protein [Chlamydiae bacterium]|nr:porin family protein [Chlamydiota bacterium]MBI3266505.1 porin family protein [Chlamydiota bacterium]
MKKFLAVALILMTLGLGKAAMADDASGECPFMLHGFYVEPNVQAFIPFNDDLSADVFAGGKAGYQFNEYFAAEVEAGWSQLDFSDDSGDVTTVPLLVNGRVNLWPGVYMVDPYLFGGIGIAFNDISIDGVDIDDSLAGQVGGGVEYHFNENFSGYVDMRFYFNDPDVNVPVEGEEDVELNGFLVGGGVVWRF